MDASCRCASTGSTSTTSARPCSSPRDRTDRWHWENDPFGRADPIEYTLASQDVNPDDTPAYGTCGSGTQCSIWSKTYSVTGAQNIRVHFSAFSVAPGSNQRTGKDYVRLYKTDGTTVIDDLTGNLGAHWSPWSGAGESAMTVDFIADNSIDLGYSGFTIDKLEYASAANGRYVMHLRMPGQIWDDDAKASYNYQRWYRREDGRYLTPDPIGLVGGAKGYFSYASSAPNARIDPDGLLDLPGPLTIGRRCPGLNCGPVSPPKRIVRKKVCQLMCQTPRGLCVGLEVSVPVAGPLGYYLPGEGFQRDVCSLPSAYLARYQVGLGHYPTPQAPEPPDPTSPEDDPFNEVNTCSINPPLGCQCANGPEAATESEACEDVVAFE